jgi:hypothetical protein
MLDPTYNAYFTDEHGNILSLLELRRSLANQERVCFNKEVNYNGGKWAESDAEYTTEYFAKNLFYFTFFKINTFGDSESAGSNFPGNQLILAPKGFDVKHKALSNIEYRIKKYGDSEFMLKWLKETKKAECNYCSCADLEAAANN